MKKILTSFFIVLSVNAVSSELELNSEQYLTYGEALELMNHTRFELRSSSDFNKTVINNYGRYYFTQNKELGGSFVNNLNNLIEAFNHQTFNNFGENSKHRYKFCQSKAENAPKQLLIINTTNNIREVIKKECK